MEQKELESSYVIEMHEESSPENKTLLQDPTQESQPIQEPIQEPVQETLQESVQAPSEIRIENNIPSNQNTLPLEELIASRTVLLEDNSCCGMKRCLKFVFCPNGCCRNCSPEIIKNVLIYTGLVLGVIALVFFAVFMCAGFVLIANIDFLMFYNDNTFIIDPKSNYNSTIHIFDPNDRVCINKDNQITYHHPTLTGGYMLLSGFITLLVTTMIIIVLSTIIKTIIKIKDNLNSTDDPFIDAFYELFFDVPFVILLLGTTPASYFITNAIFGSSSSNPKCYHLRLPPNSYQNQMTLFQTTYGLDQYDVEMGWKVTIGPFICFAGSAMSSFLIQILLGNICYPLYKRIRLYRNEMERLRLERQVPN